MLIWKNNIEQDEDDENVVEQPIDQDRTELSSGAHEARGSIESWMLPTTVHHCFRTLPDTHNFTSQLYTYLIERCTTARYSASQLCAIAFHQNSAIALTTELWHCYTTELCRRCVPQNYLQPRLVARIMTQKYESYTGTVEFARTMHLKWYMPELLKPGQRAMPCFSLPWLE